MKSVPADRDAYGQQIWSFLHGGSPLEIAEREDGYLGIASSTASYFAGFRQWPRHEREAIRLARGKAALDVGCGAGRVALHLQSRGFAVTAIDNSPLAIKTAKTRGVKDARVMPFENIGQLRDSSLDSIVMFGNNFGLFGSRTRAKRLLKTLHRITREGAVLLAQSRDPRQTNDPAHLGYQRRNRRRGRMPGQLRLRIRFQQYVGPWFDYLIVSPEEMTSIVSGTGWEIDRFMTDDEPRYAAVIRRT